MMATSNIFLSPMTLKNKFHLYQLYINHQFSPKDALFCINTLTREDVWGLTGWSLKGKNALTYYFREIGLENLCVNSVK